MWTNASWLSDESRSWLNAPLTNYSSNTNKHHYSKIIYFAIKLRSDCSISSINVLTSVLGHVTTSKSPVCSVRTVRIICRPFWLTTICLGDATELLRCCWFCPDAAAELDSSLRLGLDRRAPFKQLNLPPITAEEKKLSFNRILKHKNSDNNKKLLSGSRCFHFTEFLTYSSKHKIKQFTCSQQKAPWVHTISELYVCFTVCITFS